ncbi:MAG TPA: prepilin peptidase [Myxococcales bacterium]|nr:prepilin peptidase [Myxococcales bacterium]
MAAPIWVADAYVLVVGACVGSFVNVVIARLPHGKSLVSPPSSCPRCGARIAWRDNVPILSWLLLRGRCRHCARPISGRYPVVELLTALLIFAVWRRYGAHWETLGYAAFASALIALTYIDLDTWLLPHEITWPLLVAGLLSPLWNPSVHWPDALLGAAAGFALFGSIALVGDKLLHKEMMGWGDVWLLAGIGAWLGWKALLPVVLFSAVQGSAVGAVLLAVGHGPSDGARTRASDAAPLPASGSPTAEVTPGELDDAAARDDDRSPAPTWYSGQPPTEQPPHAPDEEDWIPPPHAVPFGPFLALAALEVLLAGDALWTWYFDAFQRLFG